MNTSEISLANAEMLNFEFWNFPQKLKFVHIFLFSRRWFIEIPLFSSHCGLDIN